MLYLARRTIALFAILITLILLSSCKSSSEISESDILIFNDNAIEICQNELFKKGICQQIDTLTFEKIGNSIVCIFTLKAFDLSPSEISVGYVYLEKDGEEWLSSEYYVGKLDTNIQINGTTSISVANDSTQRFLGYCVNTEIDTIDFYLKDKLLGTTQKKANNMFFAEINSNEVNIDVYGYAANTK